MTSVESILLLYYKNLLPKGFSHVLFTISKKLLYSAISLWPVYKLKKIIPTICFFSSKSHRSNARVKLPSLLVEFPARCRGNLRHQFYGSMRWLEYSYSLEFISNTMTKYQVDWSKMFPVQQITHGLRGEDTLRFIKIAQ